MGKNFRQQLFVDYSSSRLMEHPVYNERASKERNVSFTGFIHFSLRYIKIVNVNAKLMAILHKSLSCSSKLKYLDLSGQPITSISFLLQGPVPPIRTLILNDCTKIRTNNLVAAIMQLDKIETLSLNRVDISAREAAAIACSQPSLFMLGLVGIEFSLTEVM